MSLLGAPGSDTVEANTPRGRAVRNLAARKRSERRRMRADDAPILAFDIGGGTCRGALIAPTGGILAAQRRATPPQGEPTELADVLSQLSTGLLRGRAAPRDAAAVALPGIWDRSSGVMLRSNHLPRLIGVDLHDLFGTALQRPVWLETDVDAAAWAQWNALDRPDARFAYVSVGTGIGAGLVHGGAVQRGAALSLCDLPVSVPVDASGGAGPAEGSLQIGAPRLLEGALREALRGDAGADARDTRVVRLLGVAVEHLAVGHGVRVVALGGGAIDHQPSWVDAVAARFAGSAVAVLRAPFGTDEAGVLGAASLSIFAPRAGAP